MQISFDFEELYDSLSKVAEVSCDGMLDMAQRNFTIKTQGPEITLIGLNQQVLYHKQMTGKNLVDGVGITCGRKDSIQQVPYGRSSGRDGYRLCEVDRLSIVIHRHSCLGLDLIEHLCKGHVPSANVQALILGKG